MQQIETPPGAGFFSLPNMNRIFDRVGKLPPVQAVTRRTAVPALSSAAPFALPHEIIASMRTDRGRPKPHPGLAGRVPAIGALVACALFAAAWPAFAQSCESRPVQAQMVQLNFQRIAKEGDFASTLDYAERAQRGLEQLAAQARRCACEAAQHGFDEAAGEMRRARVADSRMAVREIAARAAARFDAAMADQRKCAGP
jgi:hypothetical protein